MSFGGVPRGMLRFLHGIGRSNAKQWCDAHRDDCWVVEHVH